MLVAYWIEVSSTFVPVAWEVLGSFMGIMMP